MDGHGGRGGVGRGELVAERVANNVERPKAEREESAMVAQNGVGMHDGGKATEWEKKYKPAEEGRHCE